MPITAHLMRHSSLPVAVAKEIVRRKIYRIIAAADGANA
jgi:hypothetical protein